MIFKTLIMFTVVLYLVSVSYVNAELDVYDIFNYRVNYEIENGEIIKMGLDTKFTSLTIEILSFDDGFVELNIPRQLIDAKFDETDDIFFILIDGTESDYIEIDSDESSRIIVIPFFANDNEIEILGTETISTSSSQIPAWVKHNAGWWSEGLLRDEDFVSGLQYLIDNGIIVIPFGEFTGMNN